MPFICMVKKQNNKRNVVIISIFKSHVKRLGVFRATVGGYLMYTTIPLFIFLHITTTTIFYSLILSPLLKLPKKKYSLYIVLDRYNLNGLSIFDRFNCLFCEYASGITMLLNSEIDTISSTKLKTNKSITYIVLLIAVCIQTVFFLMIIFLTYIPTYIFMKLLGYHRIPSKHVIDMLKKNKYAENHSSYIRVLIYIHKLVAVILMYNLKQIESQWCPIRHLKKQGIIVPKYQKQFVERDSIVTLKDIFLKSGTVADKTNLDIEL